MSGSKEPFHELGELLAALCDGELDPAQAARLEELACWSPESRQFFVEYLQLHGELYWHQAAAATPASVEDATLATPSLRRSARRWLMPLTAAAAAVLVIVAGWWTLPQGDVAGPATATPVAALTGTANAVWNGESPTAHESFAAGRTLRLEKGVARVKFAAGATVLLDGPVSFCLTSPSGGRLDAGRLTATVPAEAVGFSIQTPDAVVIDRGTEFGVSVLPAGASEVHVFTGTVDVRPASPDAQLRRLRQGEAVRVVQAAGGQSLVEIALAEHDFVRRLPQTALPAESVAALRQAADDTPGLIHHYTFEGTSRDEICRDGRGDLNLAEVVMADGRGGGQMLYSAEGYDSSTTAIRPFRGAENGNTSGASLQSEGRFHPPAEMTVELLLTFDGNIRAEAGAIAAAVATRHDRRDCGFFVSVVSDGQVVFLLDGDSAWGETDLVLQPGQWYYLAATFHAEPEANRTTVNVYAADLSRGERTLRRVADNVVVPGTPAASRLGIGKAFDGSTAHAYPWAGALDEVAIYDAVLQRHTLQKHLLAVAGTEPAGDALGN